MRWTTISSPMWASAIRSAWLPCEAPLIRNQVRVAPQASAASSCACWNGVGSGPMSTPSVTEGMSLRRPVVADQLAHRRVGAEAALVAGDLEAAGVARRVGEQSVDVRGRVLLRIGHRIESTHARRAATSAQTAVAMEHTRLGYWMEEAGRGRAGAAAGRRSRGRRARRRRRLHRPLDRLVRCEQLEPEARVVLLESERSAGAGRAAATAASATRCGARCASMRERWGDEPALAVARAAEEAVARIGAFCAEQGVDAWFRPAATSQVSTDARPRRHLDARRSTPAASSACPEAVARLERRPRCRRAAPRRPSAPAAICPSSATVQPARLALGIRRAPARGRGRDLRVLAGAQAPASRRRGRGARPRAASSAPQRAVLAIGAAAKGRAGRCAAGSPSPPRTSSSPSRSPTCSRRSAGPAARRSPTAAPSLALLPHHPGRPHRLRLGRRPDRDGRPHPAAAPRSTPTSIAATDRPPLDYFPGLAGRRVTHAWGGPIDASPTHLPTVTSLPGGRAFAAAGYTGNGVGPTQHGRPHPRLPGPRPPRRPPPASPSSTAPPPASPPSPSTGSAAKRSASASLAKEKAEMAGRRARPHRLSRREGPAS